MQLSDLDLSKTYTYADYLKWTFDERLELIKGKIFKMSPGSVHQLISGAIFAEFYNYLKGKPSKVFHAPFDVRLNKRSKENENIKTVVQPDISVICDSLKIDEKGCLGAPDIVVEILSPGNNKKELQNKYEVYEENDVLEYWIIHPSEKTFLRYNLVENRYQPSRLLTTGDKVVTPIITRFCIKA